MTDDMTDQLTVRLSPELSRALRAAARQMQRKTSEVVRMALRQYLAVPGPDGSRPAERVRGLIGSLDSGVPDLTRKHRASILQAMKHGR
jgi:ribbon-helix-helix CopG family protein